MTTATAPETTTARSVDSELAENYFTAKKVVDALAREAKPHKGIMAEALNGLAARHPEAVTPITVFGNRTERFEHRVDSSTKWAEVVKAMRPHLTAAQETMLDRIVAANQGTRTTKRFK